MLSLIVTIRDWPAERLTACLHSFDRLPPTLLDEMVVVDFGSEQPVALDGSVPRARLLRLEARLWSLGEAINAGVLEARGDVLAKTDADVLIDPRSQPGLEQAARALAAGETGLLTTQAVDLEPGVSVAEASAAIGRGEVLGGRLRPKWGQGLLTLFSRAAWAGVGGYDSRFTGWGDEDNDFCERVRRAGARIGWLDREAVRIYHVWHPPTYMRTDVARQRIANQELVKKDRSVFRTMRFRHADPSPVVAPQVLRRRHPLVTLAIASGPRPGRERLIVEAIDRFRGQIDNDFETYIIDNGSTDDEHAALRQALGRIRWDAGLRLEHSRVASIPRARNDIADGARGLYTCVVDDDDLALPNRLADHLRPFEDSGLLHGTHGGWIDFDEATGLIERNQGKLRTVATLLKGHGKITAHPANLYRTDVLRAIPYDESYVLGCDWDLALRMGALGLEIAHTGSYVTLRRFHGGNVTLTGSSNQVSSGLKARARIWSLYDSAQQAAIAAAAARHDAYLACFNDLPLDEIVELLPNYVGVWRLLVPFAELDEGSDAEGGTLGKLLALTDGDITTLRSGVNQPVVFRSAPVKGARRARRLLREVTALLGRRPQVLSDQQLLLDRQARFDWKTIRLDDGASLLRSDRLRTVAAALTALGQVAPDSLLRTVVGIVADYDADGEAYYVVAGPIQSREVARSLLLELPRQTGIPFSFVRTPWAARPTEDHDRLH